MSVISIHDPDFRVCKVEYVELLEIQREAESLKWGTRWSSVEALRRHVKEEMSFLLSFMREERAGVLRSYRCLLLFSAVGEARSGAVATIDLTPARLHSLDRLDHDPELRVAFSRIFALGMSGISMVSKE